jgi:hypothetical protein
VNYLKPGGKFVTDVTHPRTMVSGIALEKTAVRLGITLPSQRAWAQSGEVLKELTEAAGLKVEDVHLQEQQGFGKHYHEVEDGEKMWDRFSVAEIGKPLRKEGVIEKAKAIFLEEWKSMADKYGAVEEVDGVFVARAHKPEGEISNAPIMTGSCACGAYTWSAAIPPIGICHCLCAQCRKVSGAPFLTMMEFPFWAVSFKPRLAEIKTVNLKPFASRGFCDKCGTTLTFRHFEHMDHIEIAMGSMDEESLSRMSMEQILRGTHLHWTWLKDKVSWWEIPADGWNRFDEGSCYDTEDLEQ